MTIDTKKYMEALKVAQTNPEYTHEDAHIEADNVLCNLLTDLGYKHIVEEYNKIFKLYS